MLPLAGLRSTSSMSLICGWLVTHWTLGWRLYHRCIICSDTVCDIVSTIQYKGKCFCFFEVMPHGIVTTIVCGLKLHVLILDYLMIYSGQSLYWGGGGGGTFHIVPNKALI